MKKFNYRTPRYMVDLPVRITLGAGTICGHCHEISAEGMCLEIGQHISPGYAGAARLIHRAIELEIPVKFAHASPGHTGVRFAFSSDQQRRDVARLITLLTRHVSLPNSFGAKRT